MKTKVVDKIGSFGISAISELDNAIREGAVNVLVASKGLAPFDKGGLRADTEIKRVAPMLWRISYWKEYARFQEFGGDGKRTVRNYTTGGTGKGFLKKSGDKERDLLNSRLKTYAKRGKA